MALLPKDGIPTATMAGLRFHQLYTSQEKPSLKLPGVRLGGGTDGQGTNVELLSGEGPAL